MRLWDYMFTAEKQKLCWSNEVVIVYICTLCQVQGLPTVFSNNLFNEYGKSKSCAFAVLLSGHILKLSGSA